VVINYTTSYNVITDNVIVYVALSETQVLTLITNLNAVMWSNIGLPRLSLV